jgi:hypothetical protein
MGASFESEVPAPKINRHEHKKANKFFIETSLFHKVMAVFFDGHIYSNA